MIVVIWYLPQSQTSFLQSPVQPESPVHGPPKQGSVSYTKSDILVKYSHSTTIKDINRIKQRANIIAN